MEAVGQLAGGVAHDFNNLLLAIELNTHLALKSEDSAVRAQCLNEVKQATARAADLTRQLLAFGRPRPAKLVPVNLNEVVQGMLSMLRRLIAENIEIVLDPEDDLGPILADAAQIEQILLNLCVNARDAMPIGGRLTIETRNPSPSGGDAGRITLAVRDTGIGMIPETRERVFEPFFTTKAPGLGTGLGLSTVYGIVEQHKGRIVVESEPGRGTSFVIDLPSSDRSPTARAHTPSSAVLGGHETLLIAEDEPGVRSAVVGLLESAGYRVLVADNGEDAVRLFEAHAQEVALLLLDMVMPKLGGPPAARRIRESRPDIPVVFMSGYAFTGDLGPASLVRASRIDKPYEPDALLRKVREALDAERAP
jgi:CheY-like chemotaxis protein